MVAALEQVAGDLGEEALALGDPGGVGGGVVHVEAGVARQPGGDGEGLVGGVVVAHHVDLQVLWDRLVDLGQELPELRGPVTAVDRGDHGPVGDVQRGEQARRAVTDIVMTPPVGDTRNHRQGRLGAGQGLDLGLLVHTEDHRRLGRVEVQAHDVVDLLGWTA